VKNPNQRIKKMEEKLGQNSKPSAMELVLKLKRDLAAMTPDRRAEIKLPPLLAALINNTIDPLEVTQGNESSTL
jgi:hypothetical protein